MWVKLYLVSGFLLTVLLDGALFGGLRCRVESQEPMEEMVDIEQCQPAQEADQCRDAHVVVQWLVQTELDLKLYRDIQIGSPRV